MGTRDGSIIAIIITTQRPRKDAAASGHVFPGIRIHVIDIVQPPGIGISPIAAMDAHQTIVSAVLVAKRSAAAPRNASREISRPAVAPRQPRRRSALAVLIVTPPPDARLVAPPGGAGEPLVHAPEAVHSARIGGIGVVDDAALERERAQAWPLARVRGLVGSADGREGGLVPALLARARPPRRLAPVVVFDASLTLLLLGEPDVEVGVEVGAERGRPGKRPLHPPLVRLQLREGRPRYRPEHHVVIRQVHGEPVEAVRDRRAGRAPGRVVGPEHEVVDEELRAPPEEIPQRGAPLVGVESELLVDRNPRQLLAPPG